VQKKAEPGHHFDPRWNRRATLEDLPLDLVPVVPGVSYKGQPRLILVKGLPDDLGRLTSSGGTDNNLAT